jgi:hypothetical protein
MAAELRAIGDHRRLVDRRRLVLRRARLRAVSPARVIVLPSRRQQHVVADGLVAGGAGAVTLALWATVGATELMPAVTWLEMACLVALGLAASLLVALAERRPALGFGLVILFVIMTAVQLFTMMLVVEPGSTAGARAAAGSAAATAVVALVLWRRRRWLTIRP